MSNNKNKYFIVNTVSVVKADNMTEARRAASSRTRVTGTEVLARSTDVERMQANEARSYAASLES